MTIPKPVRQQRIEETIHKLDVERSTDAVEAIKALDTKASNFFDHRDPAMIKWLGERKSDQQNTLPTKTMRTNKLIMLATAAALSTPALAQNAPIFPKGALATTKTHVGDVWLSEVSGADSTFTFGIAQAVFAPGARLDWHSHPGGQILLFTDGEGYYQERGKPRQTFRKGDVVKCQPGVEHWHGATPTSGVTYLANGPAKGRTIWFKRVTDDEYAGKK